MTLNTPDDRLAIGAIVFFRMIFVIERRLAIFGQAVHAEHKRLADLLAAAGGC